MFSSTGHPKARSFALETVGADRSVTARSSYALPIRIPEAKTKAPPSITWRAETRKLIWK